MKASIKDLSKKSKEILQALERNESVTILYRGRVKGIITPAGNKPAMDLRSHPLFGLRADDEKSVQEQMEQSRVSRRTAISQSHQT